MSDNENVIDNEIDSEINISTKFKANIEDPQNREQQMDLITMKLQTMYKMCENITTDYKGSVEYKHVL